MTTQLKILLAIVTSLFLTSCLAKKEARFPYRLSVPIPAEIDQRYASIGLPDGAQKLKTKKVIKAKIETHELIWEGLEKPVKLELIIPPSRHLKKGPVPMASILPITYGNYEISKIIGLSYAMNGIASVIVHRQGSWFSRTKGIDFTEHLMALQMKTQRGVIEWLRQDPRWDLTRMIAIGTSMGAMGAPILAALEPDHRALIVLMGGGPAWKIIADSEYDTIQLFRKARSQAREQTVAEWIEWMKTRLKTDPIDFAPYVGSRKTLMAIPLYDRIIPTKYQWELRRALGYPEAITVRARHIPAGVTLPILLPIMIRFSFKQLDIDQEISMEFKSNRDFIKLIRKAEKPFRKLFP